MPSRNTLENFIAMVEKNLHAEAIEAFYAEDASITENQSAPRIGRSNLAENERKMLSSVARMTSKCVRPVFISDAHVVIRWKFHFEWKNGSTSDIEEIAYQVWEDEKILHETFFYDPAQFPKKDS